MIRSFAKPHPFLTALFTVMSVCTAAQAQDVLWTYSTTAGYLDSSPAIGDVDGDGVEDIVVACTAGPVIAIDANGREIWRTQVEDRLSIAPAMADVTGDPEPEILVLTETGRAVCLEARTGRILWTYATGGEVKWGSMAIAAADINNDGAVEVIAGNTAGRLVCLSGEGRLRWKHQRDDGFISAPAVGDLDGDGVLDILIGTTESPLVCLSQRGKELWRLKDGEATGSAPVVWDLDGDGKKEILVGVGKGIAAVSSRGRVTWTHAMKNIIDSAISVADADADGQPEIYVVDLSGTLACLAPDGSLRWTADVEQRARRSPSIADVDGDGVAEILVAGYSGAIHVFDPAGKLENRVPIKSGTNATATVADFWGDGRLTVICPEISGDLVAWRWPGIIPNPTVLWPEYRFNPQRTASRITSPRRALTATGIRRIDYGDGYVGTNSFSVRVNNPARRPLSIRLEVGEDGRSPLSTVLHSSKPEIEAELPYTLTGSSVTDLTFSCQVKDGRKTVAERTHRERVVPFIRELSDLDNALARMETLLPGLPDATGIEGSIHFLKFKLSQRRGDALLATSLSNLDRRGLRDELAALRGESGRLLALMEEAGRVGDLLAVYAANPWAPFGGVEELMEGRNARARVQVSAFGGEIESAAFNLFNFSGRPITVRVMPDSIESGEGKPSVPARNVLSFHEVIDVPTQRSDMAADALPRLGPGQTLMVPAWGARQLWTNVDASKLAPGKWAARIRLRTLEVESVEATADLDIEVWNPRLPEEQPLRLCHWGYVDRSVLKDQPEAALADQVAHGTNVFVGLHYPAATFDEAGNLVGEIDFADHDAYVHRYAPHGIILFFNYQTALTGPAPRLSPAWRKAHVTYLRAWVKHLAVLGVGYDGFALYPEDEPGLDGSSRVEEYLELARLAREADPKIRLYTDPVGQIKLEELRSMAPLVDIWCPNHYGFLVGENEEKLDLIKTTGAEVWTYECADNAKHQSPLGYYRAQAWLVWRHGIKGIGFWSYCTSQFDPWFRPSSGNDYLLIYQGEGVVSSKRWEAVRDGIEDYSMLHLLKEAAEQHPEIASGAKRLLTSEASAIGAFCGVDDDGTLPGQGGLKAARALADRRWARIQTTRRRIADMLSTF